MTAHGPLGLVRVCGRRLHGLFDVIGGVLLLVSPLFGPLRPGVAGIVAAELAGVAWLRVTTLTRYSAHTETRAGPATPGTAIGAAAAGPVGPAPGAGGVPPVPALSAVRRLGVATARARRRLPAAAPTLDAGARQMGAHAGRLQRAWRRATR